MRRTHTPQPLWGYREVAEYLRMTPAALRNRVHRNEIPHIRVGLRTVRFDPARIVSWVENSHCSEVTATK